MAAYVPDRGDIVWLRFEPGAGHEQTGRRPALVVSPRAYNRKAGLALLCPITTVGKGYPFEVALPAGAKARGVVLCDHIKSLDWRARGAKRIERAPEDVVATATSLLRALIDPRT